MAAKESISGGAMRKVFSITLLALAFAASASAGAAQESTGAKVQKDKPAAASTQNSQDKARKKDGSDCSPQRAGVRCSRPKPKNPWFFGK
jgi:hypothetical protein